MYLIFPDSSVGKESACSAGDPGSIPGSEDPLENDRLLRLQYSWASLVAQLVKTLLTIQVDLGSIPGLARAPGKGKGCLLKYSGLENYMDCSPWGRKESDTTELLSLCTSILHMIDHLEGGMIYSSSHLAMFSDA